MPRKSALTLASLKSLGLERLATLLLAACDNDGVLEKTVRMMLAAKDGGDALDAELTKRIRSLARSRKFYDWRHAGDLARTIDTIRSGIVVDLAGGDPIAAADRLWQLIEASGKIIENVDDSSGATSSSLRAAVGELGQMLSLRKTGAIDPARLAGRIHENFLDNGYGIKDGLVRSTAPALGAKGRAILRGLFEGTLAELEALSAPPDGSHDEYHRRSLRSAAAHGMMEIADAEGDVDAFLDAAALSPYTLAHVDEAAERLLEAGRPEEALSWLESVPPDHGQWRDAGGDGLVGLKLRALEALGRADEAQVLRWQMFERYLWAGYLRAYVKKLPDFEDDEVLRKAIAHAMVYPGVLDALNFLVGWPELEAAEKLVVARAAEIDGRHYEILNRAIDRLANSHPLAATILLRAKIDSVLARAASTQYAHAARDLAHAAALAGRVDGCRDIPTHADYMAGLKVKHARKTSFWPKVKEAGQ